MLPEVGALEYLVIAAVALIVVGPKDLPGLLRKLGQFVAKLRSMANEFRASFDEMARQSELDELRKEVEAMRRGQLVDQTALSASNHEAEQVFREIESGLQGGDFQFHPPMSHQVEAPPVTIEAVDPPTPKAPRKPREPKAEVAVAAEAPAKPARKRKTAKTGDAA